MSGSPFWEKVFSGQSPADEEWTAYLREAHARVPGMTPPAFGAYRTRAGLNSYEVLAAAIDRVRGPVALLDLACGDGYLLHTLLPRLDPRSTVVAVDMVASEVEAAKARFRDPRVRFLCEEAQALSLPAASVDAVLCHMALMLMRPIEPVLAQLRRVLRPGGRVAAVIGGPRVPGSLCGEIAELIAGFLKRRFPGMSVPRTGDARFGTVEGLRELFSPARGFDGAPRVEDFQIELKGDLDRLWGFYKDMYLVGALPEALRADLRVEMEASLRPHADGRGVVRAGYPMRLFEVGAR